MTIDELILNVRSKVEPSVDANNSQIKTWLQEQFYIAISYIQEYNPKKFNKVVEINILNNVQEYKLPDDFLAIKKVEINHFDEGSNKVSALQLDSIDFEDIQGISGNNQKALGNRYYVRDGNVGISPMPNLNSLHNIRIYYYYEPDFTDEGLALLPRVIQLALCRGAVADYLLRDMEYGAASTQQQLHEKKLKTLCRTFAKDDRSGVSNLISEQTRFGYHRPEWGTQNWSSDGIGSHAI